MSINANKFCPNCGKPLAPGALLDLCPECMMKAGLGSQPESGDTVVASGEALRHRELPKTGESFGGYRIVRELGRGGMGAVYEAEHLESGRRVALKVLSHQLDSHTARARFLREGRLAASINHPNSVYVYGTEEIAGTPAISMELIAGGTLQERVQRGGPLPVGEAVDAILQVIAGLEAAQALGILHRDIKPSNCFEDADGTVKIGDFGLSISTAARGDTNITLHGTFLGTPTFSSPEQLRGEEINARSDMYAVGVTLFYLLTAHTPFEAQNMVQLLALVLEQAAPSPKTFRPDLPNGLCKAILRCLEKSPGERFKNYDELRQALAPFGSDAPVPAPLGLRFAAGAVDLLLLSAFGATIGLVSGGATIAAFTSTNPKPSISFLPTIAFSFLVMLLYYAILEGLWGASAGKALFRLRVAGPNRNPPGVRRALLRAAIYVLVPLLPYWIAFGFSPYGFFVANGRFAQHGFSLLYYVVLALLFCTARRRNGYAASHDLLTGTRVIRKPALHRRPVLEATIEPLPALETSTTVGPYHVLKSLEKTAEGDWLLGYDTRLLRKVWLHIVPSGTPPIAPRLRNLGRAGRLRWITGRRSPEESWDAFEGVGGRALLDMVQRAQPWTWVRFWLLDLANELSAANKDGTVPSVLAIDRVWITADGRAKLLDFPASVARAAGRGQSDRPPRSDGVEASPPEENARSTTEVQRFLTEVAIASLEGRIPEDGEATAETVKAPLPLHARTFLGKLHALLDTEAIASTLKPLTQSVVGVSRTRRAALLAGCLAFPIVAGLGFLVATRILARWQQAQPGIMELSQVLNQRSAMKLPWFKNTPHPDDRAFGIYIASHFQATVTNTASLSTLYALSLVNGANREFAERSVAQYAGATEKEIAEAVASVKPILPSQAGMDFATKPWFALVVAGASLLLYVCLPALVAALLFRGGLVLRICGVAVTRRDGLRASRLRVFWRSLVTWSPIPPILAALLTPMTGGVGPAIVLIAPTLALVACSLALPDRSLQDRLAGTRLVPR